MASPVWRAAGSAALAVLCLSLGACGDAETGSESARYLDPRALPDGRLSVDFNFAYNPYCAYSEGWSCPIPPAENVTKAPIRAGERSMESGVGSRE